MRFVEVRYSARLMSAFPLGLGFDFSLTAGLGCASGRSSLNSTEMIFIIGQVFRRCTNIFTDFHRRHCLEGNKTAGAECKHGDIQVLRQRY